MFFKNRKIAFVFPGQGAQYVGMGMDFVENDETLLQPLLDFDNNNSTNLYEIIKNGPAETLKETKWTQPAIMFHSITALNSMLKSIAVKPHYVAGHSLGEFTALVANGVLKAEDALYLVHKRGQFMIKANEDTPYAMAAIIGLDTQKLQSICKKISEQDLVVVANYNTPEQTVISGTADGVAKACQAAKEAGAKRALPLPVGGAFHSPLIARASDWLIEEMNKITFHKSAIPVIANVDAQPYTDPETIKHNLAKQVTSSVLWVDSINYLTGLGVDLFFEFGPKKIIAGMIKKIDRNVEVISIDKYEDLLTLKESIS